MMKKLDSKLFSKKEIIEKKEMNDVLGGASTNNSGDGKNGTNVDTKLPHAYDIAVETIWDVYETKTKNDKPSVVEAPSQIASFSVAVQY
jgi:hypothetical protein